METGIGIAILWLSLGFIYAQFFTPSYNTWSTLAIWPFEVLVKIVCYIERQNIYKWMSLCDLMRNSIRNMQKQYLNRSDKDLTWPEFCELHDYESSSVIFITDNCLEPALSFFRLKNTPEGWESAFKCCLRIKRKEP